MPAIRINPDNGPQAYAELVDESAAKVVAKGYLEVDLLPSRPGDRIGSLVWVATDVLFPDATTDIVAVPEGGS